MAFRLAVLADSFGFIVAGSMVLPQLVVQHKVFPWWVQQQQVTKQSTNSKNLLIKLHLNNYLVNQFCIFNKNRISLQAKIF